MGGNSLPIAQVRGVARAIKVGGIYENVLATSSNSLKIYYTPHLFSHGFHRNPEHHFAKSGGALAPPYPPCHATGTSYHELEIG